MFTGWIVKWKLDRPLWQKEKDNALPRSLEKLAEKPNDKTSLVRFNSTYIEFVDRRYRLRGGFYTLLQLLAVFAILIAMSVMILTHLDADGTTLFSLILLSCFIVMLLFFWFWFWRKEFASPTYYPIRFNRKTRKIYVYRDKRDGGLLTLPWEEGYFHIGTGYREKFLLDLRCHVLDGDIVKDTFPVGHYFDDPKAIKGMWAFILGYMEKGPKAVQPEFIYMSVLPTWENCRDLFTVFSGVKTKAAFAIFSPFIYSLAGCRWLVMKTCTPPVWPAQIEAECQVEENDPFDMPQPTILGEFIEEE